MSITYFDFVYPNMKQQPYPYSHSKIPYLYTQRRLVTMQLEDQKLPLNNQLVTATNKEPTPNVMS